MVMATVGIQHLRHAIPVSSCPYMVPSYNALVSTARANHPEDSFLKILTPIPTNSDDRDYISIAEINALLAQLIIALEPLS
ncbi:hypothetical protein [Armatimonas sp.]|uniref:hypothetical protein n=1 Tax=Armatimonas sp. TaxID=1872638 RepID=UPI00286B52EA|nr:hypothetical protein [Armatimonas sp.]